MENTAMPKWIAALKGAVALAVLVGLVAFVSGGVFPGASPYDRVVGTVAALAIIAVALGIALVASLRFRQWALRKGARDPQWFWFRADPPGLESLRAKDPKA